MLLSVISVLSVVLTIYIILAVVIYCMYPPRFFSHVITHYDSSITDYKIFPERIIRKGEKPYIMCSITTIIQPTFLPGANLTRYFIFHSKTIP